jgi:putative nucleotidyltransferase with HDIG domain
MAGTCILLLTREDALRDTFSAVVGDPRLLPPVRNRSDIQRVLRSQEVTAVFAESDPTSPMGLQALKWIHGQLPWIRYVVLCRAGENDPSLDRRVRQFAHVVPMPRAADEVRKLLHGVLPADMAPGKPRRSAVATVQEIPEDADADILRSITEFIDQLPSLPVVVQRILHLLQKDDASNREVADTISLDPALSARVLRLVNSALYGLSTPVTTIQRAVAMLGFSELNNTVLGLKVVETFSGAELSVLDRDRFWEHSLACAICAQRLAGHVRVLPPGETFLGGLLHDIGKLVLDDYFRDEWAEALETARSQRRSTLEVETEVLGVPHTVVGRMLAARWKIPEIHQAAILHHHDVPAEGSLPEKERLLCAVVCAADLMVRWMDLGSSGYSPLRMLPGQMLDLLGLGEQQIEETLAGTARDVRGWKETLGLTGRASECPNDSPSSSETSDEPSSLWTISPRQSRHPSVPTLLAASGHRVHRTHWGERILDGAAQVTHEAIVMDLRGCVLPPEKWPSFLRALRSVSPAPVLVVHSDNVSLPVEPEDHVQFFRGAPRLGALHRWIRSAAKDAG